MPPNINSLVSPPSTYAKQTCSLPHGYYIWLSTSPWHPDTLCQYCSPPIVPYLSNRTQTTCRTYPLPHDTVKFNSALTTTILLRSYSLPQTAQRRLAVFYILLRRPAILHNVFNMTSHFVLFSRHLPYASLGAPTHRPLLGVPPVPAANKHASSPACRRHLRHCCLSTTLYLTPVQSCIALLRL